MSDKLLGVLCTIFFISLAVIITLHFRPLYYWEIDYLELESKTGLSKDEMKANYDAIIDYNGLFHSDEKLNLPTLPLSQNASIHFQEVKNIFNKVYYLCIVTFIFSLIFILFKMRSKKFSFLKFTAIFNIALPVFLGIIIFISWDSFFIAFHKLFFENDYWLFDPYIDPVINILPDMFFMHSVLILAALILVSSVLCGIIYRILNRKTQ